MLVYAEVMEYIRGSADFRARLRGFRSLLRDIQLIAVTREIADTYAVLRRSLRPPHRPGLIGDMDTMIAATALARRLTLETADSDFQRVPDPRLRLVSPHG
jgi:predicted nucleic acid-binding protein